MIPLKVPAPFNVSVERLAPPLATRFTVSMASGAVPFKLVMVAVPAPAKFKVVEAVTVPTS